MTRRLSLLVAALVLASVLPARASDTPCASYAPFASLEGASLTATNFTSKDGVAYVMFRGFAPSFDGMPMSVDVTIPCGASGPIPLVTMNHGWTDDKTIWEETGRSETTMSEFRRAANSHWNNIWFASRGYAVLNYTARGWHDSCGPNAPGSNSNIAPSSECQKYQYWIHMDDQRWEVRDAQWLTAALVQSGVADPARLMITGGSYGGGVTIQAAVLNDRIVCGASAEPSSLGVDPCAGKSSGEMVPWATPDGATRLSWRVAVPMYTWSDVERALLPNGRTSDGWLGVPDGSTVDPVGVPIESYIAGLYAAGQPLGNGFFSPPGADGTGDITVLSARTLAGGPFTSADPIVANGIGPWRSFRSAITLTPDADVPIFWVQGMTDPLFTAFEPLAEARRLRAFDPAYPIKMFFGDMGHDYASDRIDEWDVAHASMNDFVDHYLKGAGDAPAFDVTAAITRCLNFNDPMELVTAPTWDALHDGAETFIELTGAATASEPMTQTGLDTDPVSGASIPGPQAYKGCRIMRPAVTDPNAASSSWTLDHAVTMLGAPVIDVTYATAAPDAELNVRLWDVTPDGSAQALVTRGTYRTLDGPGTALRARFELAPQGYRWLAGHTLKLEVTANDAPYRQPDNVAGIVDVSSVSLALPTRA